METLCYTETAAKLPSCTEVPNKYLTLHGEERCHYNCNTSYIEVGYIELEEIFKGIKKLREAEVKKVKLSKLYFKFGYTCNKILYKNIS